MINIQRTQDSGFNLKFIRDMTKTYSQMHCKDRVFVQELSDCGLETTCSYLIFEFRICFEQQGAQHSDN